MKNLYFFLMNAQTHTYGYAYKKLKKNLFINRKKCHVIQRCRWNHIYMSRLEDDWPKTDYRHRVILRLIVKILHCRANVRVCQVNNLFLFNASFLCALHLSVCISCHQKSIFTNYRHTIFYMALKHIT